MFPRLTAFLAALALAGAAPLVAAQAKSPSASKEKQERLSRQDRNRFRDIAQGNLAEIEAGKLAQQRAASPEVKKFAEQMVQDHGRMLQEQQQMAKSKGIEMPKEAKKEHRSAMEKLEKAKGERFDVAYMEQMVKDHEKTLELVRETAKEAKDPELKAMAEKAAPEIEKHLQMAKQLSGQAAGGGTARPKSSK